MTRVRCNNWRVCTSIICKHKHVHFKIKSCADSCDEPGYVECKKVHIRKKQNNEKARGTNSLVLRSYVTDADTRYTLPGSLYAGSY